MPILSFRGGRRGDRRGVCFCVQETEEAGSRQVPLPRRRDRNDRPGDFHPHWWAEGPCNTQHDWYRLGSAWLGRKLRITMGAANRPEPLASSGPNRRWNSRRAFTRSSERTEAREGHVFSGHTQPFALVVANQVERLATHLARHTLVPFLCQMKPSRAAKAEKILFGKCPGSNMRRSMNTLSLPNPGIPISSWSRTPAIWPKRSYPARSRALRVR